VLNPDGVFHPKVYLFEKPGGEWECVVGSPNFTQSGFGPNDEMAVLVTNKDQGAQDALDGIRTSIDQYWQKASRLDPAKLEAYRETWNRKRLVVEALLGVQGRAHAVMEKTTLLDKWNNYVVRRRPDNKSSWNFQIVKGKIESYARHGDFNIVIICDWAADGEITFRIPYHYLVESVLPYAVHDEKGRFLFEIGKRTNRFNWHHGISMDGNCFLVT
jgi:hypothetical protein